jgi:transcriptional regulator with XRE-family HTH domain
LCSFGNRTCVALVEKHTSIDIGWKIAQLRKANNLSLQKLAKKAGMSPSGLYKIEKNGYTPSISTLINIARALGRTVSYFVDEEDGSNLAFVKRKDRRKFTSGHSLATMEIVSGGLKEGLIEAGFSYIKEGGISGSGLMSHAKGEELVVCLKGNVEYQVEKKKFHLQEGDCIHFKSQAPHSWRNLYKGVSIIFWVLSPPTF